MLISFREAVSEDYEFARRTHHGAYRAVILRQHGKWDEPRQDEYFAESWSEGRLEIVMEGGVPCGYVGVDQKADRLVVREIVIAPEHQGRGLGTRILQGYQSLAAERRIPVRLQVLIANEGARRLYDRLGFVETGVTFTHISMQWNPESPRPPEWKPKTKCSV